MARNLAFHLRCVKVPSLQISIHRLIINFCLEVNFVLALKIGRSINIHSELVSPLGFLAKAKSKHL